MKFMTVVLFAVILAANAKTPKLSDIVKAYEETNTIGENTSAANHVLYIPTAQRTCTECVIKCQEGCERLGFKYGICTATTAPCSCLNELPTV